MILRSPVVFNDIDKGRSTLGFALRQHCGPCGDIVPYWNFWKSTSRSSDIHIGTQFQRFVIVWSGLLWERDLWFRKSVCNGAAYVPKYKKKIYDKRYSPFENNSPYKI